jgi:hypothetical protein
MKRKPRPNTLAAWIIAAAGATAPTTPSYAQGIPVYDNLSVIQQFVDYVEQGMHYIQLLDQYKQLVKSYALEIQNLQQLPGAIRSQISGVLSTQLTTTLNDMGLSNGGNTLGMNTKSATYYSDLEAKLRTTYGALTSTMATLNASLSALGLPANATNPTYTANLQDRMKYEQMLDQFRLASQIIQNGRDREGSARSVTAQMASLPDNNTVGAIQLLGAQNALNYAQLEDLLKVQAAQLKAAQDQEARVLAERDQYRQAELNRLTRAAATRAAPAPTVNLAR